jgi:NAD-dependent deacetylase
MSAAAALEEKLVRARELVSSGRRILAFTGAGVSTPSGIPDFRSPGGVWSRFQPVTIQEFLISEEARQRYWEMRRLMWPDFVRAEPNVVHRALARVEQSGRLQGVVTQNIDGLHQLAGSRKVVELHGTNRRVECMSCHRESDMAAVQAELLEGQAPRCRSCGGPLKAATISFGQALRPDVVREAFALASSCDVLLALGSSLVVYPAAALPEAAAGAGAKLILVNRDETPLDHLATVLIHGPLEEVVPAVLGGD